MKIVEGEEITMPYSGGIFKHPSRNLVVKMFSGMDYLLFMDFDSTDYYAIHQSGSLTFEGIYEREKPLGFHFTLSSRTSDFFILTYYNGSYTIDAINTGKGILPEILFFDWEGNYLTGMKMKQPIKSMGYDELHKVLYVVDYEDKLHAYDFKDVKL